MLDFLKKHVGIIVTFVIGILIMAFIISFQSDYYDMTGNDRNLVFSNGFFVASVMLLGSGLLMWVATLGAFDHIGYIMSLMVYKLRYSKDKFEQRKSYLDYIEQKHKKEKDEKSKHPRNTILAGLVFLAFAVLFNVLFAMYK